MNRENFISRLYVPKQYNNSPGRYYDRGIQGNDSQDYVWADAAYGYNGTVSSGAQSTYIGPL